MSRAEETERIPRAMIHRRILDVAESNPDASISAIAKNVSGASPELVDKVLEEYGDPAAESKQSTDPSDTAMVTENGSTEPVDSTEADEKAVTLSDKQRTTLRAVHENPSGSQGDIAEELGVTRATVSRRLNSIPGFEWAEREAFAESVFGERSDGSVGQSANDQAEHTAVSGPDVEAGSDAGGDSEREGGVKSGGQEGRSESTSVAEAGSTPQERDDAGDTSSGATDGDQKAALDDLERRVAALETTTRDGGNAVSLPPELAHKVVHACMESDRVSEDEELELLRVLLAE